MTVTCPHCGASNTADLVGEVTIACAGCGSDFTAEVTEVAQVDYEKVLNAPKPPPLPAKKPVFVEPKTKSGFFILQRKPMVCTACEAIVTPAKRKDPGFAILVLAGLVALFSFDLAIIIGVVGILVSAIMSPAPICPGCEKRSLIPTDSPRGKEILKKHYSEKPASA